jgi:hypothetical protein
MQDSDMKIIGYYERQDRDFFATPEEWRGGYGRCALGSALADTKRRFCIKNC